MVALRSTIKEYFSDQNLAFAIAKAGIVELQMRAFVRLAPLFNTHYLYKAVENNSTRKQLCTQVTTKNSSNMKQLSLFDLFDELQSQSTAKKAGLEKQSNLSSNITASNNASEEKKVVEVTAQEVADCHLMRQWKEIKAQLSGRAASFPCR